MNPVLITVLLIAVAMIGLVVFCVLKTLIRVRRLSKLSPPTPFQCPICKSEEIDFKSGGLWHGRDAQGQHIGGAFTYGICKKCGSRCGRTTGDQPYVPSDEEWRQHFEPGEKLRKDAEAWPFIEGDHGRQQS